MSCRILRRRKESLQARPWSRYVPPMAKAAPIVTHPIVTDLVLLGAGHAHLEVLRRFAMRPDPALRVTVVARAPRTLYSGMLPGLIRGDYDFAAAHVDLAPLAAAAGATLLVAEARGIDPVRRAIRLDGVHEIGFDLLSIDIGGVPAMPPDAGTPVRPIDRFLHRLDAVATGLPAGGRIAVIGGGAGGTELALAVKRRFAARVTLICAGREPPSAPPCCAPADWRAMRMAA